MTIYDDLYSAPEGLYTINPPPYQVSASFRMFHESLEPETITKEFQIAPSDSHRKGDARKSRTGKEYSPYPKGAWLLSTRDKIDSVDANDHINWLLDTLLPCRELIKSYQDQEYFTDIHCGWHTDGWNTCPCLDKETIAKLARFRLDCWFDVYGI